MTRARPAILTPGATPEEAAAIVAALQRFRRDTALAPPVTPDRRSPWLEASLREGVARAPELFPTWT